MPMARGGKYTVETTNRFQIADSSDSSDSDDDTCQNVDPFAMIKQAEIDAAKQAKLKAKEAQKVKATIQLKQEKEKPEEEVRKPSRREPRGNQQPRRGPRNERNAQDNDNALSENNNQTARDDSDRRQRRPKRDQDRRSGNPRSGVKATEKKGGHGAGNWGKATEKPEDFIEKPESETPSAENVENADPEKEEKSEPKEPEEVTLTLEEYYAQSVTETTEQKSTNSRKANNGEALKGKVIRKNKIFTERKQQAAVREASTKVVVPNEQLAFVSGRQRNYRYNDNNNDRRQGGNRRNNFDNKQGGQKEKVDFSKPSTDFPELGK